MELMRGHGTGYQPTPLEDIDYWFDHLPLKGTLTRTFVDVGCGEGVVLERWRLRSSELDQHPLLVGIESDIDLAASAAPHADMLLTGDAATFDYARLPQPLLLWLFNPFGAEPMMQLIAGEQRCRISLDRAEGGWVVKVEDPAPPVCCDLAQERGLAHRPRSLEEHDRIVVHVFQDDGQDPALP